jgi:hypothetical protein
MLSKSSNQNPYMGRIEGRTNMSDGTSNGTSSEATNATAKTPTKQRESRNNHSAATSHPITDATTAQAYCDSVRTATINDKASSMFNASGFVTPGSLDNQDTENLVRMGASINDALARRVSQDGGSGQSAQNGLNILSDHARNAADIQTEARNQRILAEAAAIQARQSSKTATARR